MKKIISPLLAILLISMLTNCAQISGLQTAKTVGKGNIELAGALGARAVEVNGEFVGRGTTEFWGRYGIREKVDVGMKVTTAGNSLLDFKWQFIGNQRSVLAVATGLGVGLNGLAFAGGAGAVVDVHIPVYTSLHLGRKFAVYANPRFVNQYVLAGTNQGQVKYAGLSSGIEVGHKLKAVLDYSYFGVGNEQQNVPIQQLSLGFKLRIGD